MIKLTKKEEQFILDFIDTLVEYDVARDLYDEPTLDSLNDELYDTMCDNVDILIKALKESLDNQLRMRKFVKLVAQYGIKQLEGKENIRI